MDTDRTDTSTGRGPGNGSGVIVKVDPFDREAFDAWHATYAAGERAGREQWATPWRLEEFRTDAQSPVSYEWKGIFGLVVDGAFVATAEVWMPLLENLDLVQMQIHTHPDHRRRGYATRMLEHVEDLARARGRNKLMTETSYPYDAPADGAGEAGPEFLTRHGFEFGLGDVMRLVELPLDDRLLEQLAEQAAPHHAAYTLRSFVGPVPEELAQGFAEVAAAISADAPMGDLDFEPDTPNVTSMREAEAIQARQRRTKYNTVALDASGDVVAYTELVMSEEDPGAVYQWGTLVRKAHRGHRLGLAVKTENLRFLQGLRSDARRLITYNAEVNSHMIAVNEQLGFRPVERLGEFQKRLP